MSTYVVTLVIEDLDETEGNPARWDWAKLLDLPTPVSVLGAAMVPGTPTAGDVTTLSTLSAAFHGAVLLALGGEVPA